MSDVTRGSFQDNKLAAKIIERDGTLFMEVTDRVAGWTWAQTPLLKLEIHDKRLRREERVDKYHIESLEITETGAHVTVTDKTFGVAVGVWFRITHGELSVKFVAAEAYENDPVLFRLFSMDVLPSLMRVMTSIVWGASVRDEWGVRPTTFGGIGVFSDARAAGLKAMHDLCVEKYGYLLTEEMTRCVMSSDFQQVQTAFADGTEVSADFVKQELIVNGKRVERPAGLLDTH